MSLPTNAIILARHGYKLDEIEFPDLVIPVLSESQRQGDVLVLKIDDGQPGQPIGRGVEVVRSEVGANTHTLHGEGTWLPNPAASDTAVLTKGWLAVPVGGEAWLIHSQEHSAIGIGPGTYEIRRQREFAGEWRQVSD